jgi:hypothetical protein
VATVGLSTELSPEARDALVARADREGVTPSRMLREIACGALGLDPGPRPSRRPASDEVPRLCALAAREGGVTIAEAERATGLPHFAAAKRLRTAHRGGLLTGRHSPTPGVGGRGPMVYRATALGRRMAAE